MYSEQLFQYVANNFDFAFVICINIIAYLIISLIGYITKKQVSKVVKIGITIATSIMLFFLYGGITSENKEVLLNSSILAPIAWDWIIKPLCKWINIDYKNNSTE